VTRTLKLELFAEIVSRKPELKTVSYESLEWFEGLSDKCLTEVTVVGVPVEDDSGNTVSLKFLALPSGVGWPCFMQCKKGASLARSVILVKNDVEYPDLAGVPGPASSTVRHSDSTDANLHFVDDGRLESTNAYPADAVPATASKRLLMQNSVAFVGHSGVGKSVEMSIVLLHLLRRLVGVADGSDKASKLRYIFLRIDFVLYRFHIENSVILCDVPSFFVGRTMHELTIFLDCLPRQGDRMVDDAVLLLELNNEVEPALSFVPTLMALSSEGASSLLEPKRSEYDVVVRPPHSPEALIALATASYLLNPDAFAKAVGLKLPASQSSSSATTEGRDAVRSLTRSRIQRVGPLARVVLSDNAFSIWNMAVNSSAAEAVLKDLQHISVLNIPRRSGYLVAPYTRTSVRFLSPVCRDLVRDAATVQDMKLLSRTGLESEMVAGVVLKYLVMNCGDAVPEFRNYKEWVFYHNPSQALQLGDDQRVDETHKRELIASSVGHTRKVIVSESILPVDANKLRGDTVYLVATAASSAGAFMTFDGVAKRITLYLMHAVDPCSRPMTIDKLLRYSQEGSIDLQVIYFVPSESGTARGVKVVEFLIKEGVGMKSTISDDEVRQRLYGTDAPPSRYRCFIVSCGVHDSQTAPSILLAPQNSPVSLLDFVQMVHQARGERLINKKVCRS
jgi:hypothetical protein